MPRRRSEGRDGGRRRRRSRSRRRSASGEEDPAGAKDDGDEEPYRLEICRGRHADPLPMFDIQIAEEATPGAGEAQAAQERVVPHICARLGEGYVIRVTNTSRRHIACAVTVDGENALLRDGSLIVAPRDSRELPGFLVSKNFVGREYVKEYRDFRFGKPKVVEGGPSNPSVEDQPYQTYGRILCEVFEAVLDEEVDSDQELRGQTTFYRGAGLNGSFDDRLVPEGKKKHFLYSSVTVQGPRSAISNSTRGRWWVRGQRRLRTLEVRCREAHSLMLLGVDSKVLGLSRCKEEENERIHNGAKLEGEGGKAKKEEEDFDEKRDKKPGGPDSGYVEVCDLTGEGDDDAGGGGGGAGAAVWSLAQGPSHAAPVDVEGGGAAA